VSWGLLRRIPRSASLALVYVGLTVVVWGTHAGSRTLWQDDAQNLFRAFSEPGGLLAGALARIGSPTRRLTAVPHALALATGHPRVALQLTYGLVWLATGLLAHRLARRLFPGLRAAPFLAGALTLCATSDFLTNSLVAISYLLAVLSFLAGLTAFVAWLDGASAARLVLGGALAQASLFTADAALPAFVVTPLLARLVLGSRGRRFWIGSAVWLLLGVPYLMLLTRFLGDPAGYAAVALQARPWLSHATRAVELAAYNFTPWRWAFERPMWFAATDPVIPFWLRGLLAAGGTTLFAVVALRTPVERADARARVHPLAAVAACVALAGLVNAAFAPVHMSEFFVRTHLHSRVWSSLALAGVCGWLASRGRWRVVTLGVPTAFVALGLLGGLERQDYFLGYSQRHRAELTSILRAAPSLVPGATLLLYVPAHRHFLATDAPYLARAWMTLLYADPAMECRVFVWFEAGPGRCELAPDALVCESEMSPRCALPGAALRYRYDRILWLTYDPATNGYRNERQIPEKLRGGVSVPPLADPATLVAARPWSGLARDLLGDPPAG
jgi:hypothetical protein